MPKINETLSSVVKYFRPKTAHSDDFNLSAIHYKLLFGLLLVSSLLSGLNSWYAQIECSKLDSKSLDVNLVKQWCYANSMFVVDSENNTGPYGLVNTHAHATNKVVNLSYYQWVTLALFAQAVCFQIPRILWKSFEGGRVRRMADSVKNLEFVEPTERAKKISLLVDYFLRDARRRQTRNYFLYFAVCQAFYLINTAGQIYFTETFLNDQFVMLVPQWLRGDPILDRVFPMQAKCKYYDHGPGGDLQMHDFTCVLAMNILIRKLYLLLWFLLAIASIASLFQTFYLVGLFISTTVQRNLSKDKEFLDKLSCSTGDCLLLKFLKESVDCVVYAEFKELALLRLAASDPNIVTEKI